jgi:hypothetical protein
MVPSFAYNAIRTGSLLRPATAAPMYLQGANALDGSVPHGIYGLLISPNRGLFVFSPALLAAAALPFVWRRLSPADRRLLAGYGAAAAAYLLLIAKMSAWGTFGWGPRYLLPIVPIVFVAAAAVSLRVRTTVQTSLVVTLVVVSGLVTLPTAFVNWSLAVGTSPAALDPDSGRPDQFRVAWHALADGLRGRPPIDSMRGTPAVFPDFLLVRLWQRSTAGAIVAAASGLSLSAAAVSALKRIVQHD